MLYNKVNWLYIYLYIYIYVYIYRYLLPPTEPPPSHRVKDAREPSTHLLLQNQYSWIPILYILIQIIIKLVYSHFAILIISLQS